MLIGSRRLAGERQQILEKFFRLFRRHAGNTMGVSADKQRRSPSTRVKFHQGTKRRFRIVKSVTRAHLDMVTNLSLGIEQGVMSRQPSDSIFHAVIEGVVGCPHVRPLGLPSYRWNNLSGQHGAL